MDALMHGCMYARTHVPDPFCEQSLAVVAGWYFPKGIELGNCRRWWCLSESSLGGRCCQTMIWFSQLQQCRIEILAHAGLPILPSYTIFVSEGFRRKRNKLGTCMGSMENGVLAMETQISIRCNVVFLFFSPREHNWFTLYPPQSTVGCLVFQDILTLDWAGQYWNIHLQHRFPGRPPIICLYDSPQKLCQKSELRASKMAGQTKFLDLIHHWYPHFEIPLLLMKSSPVLVKSACLLNFIHTFVW